MWAFVTVVVAAVAAIFALRQLRASIHAGAEQARPYVTTDIVFRDWGGIAVEVKNSGLTAARNIEFEWSDRPQATHIDAQVVLDRGVVDGGIPFLAPGRAILYDLGRYGDLPETSPRRFDVKMRYRGSADNFPWTSESIVDIEQWADTLVGERDPYRAIVAAIKELKTQPRLGPLVDRKTEAADALAIYLEAQPEVRRERDRRRAARWRAGKRRRDSRGQ